MSFCLRPNVCKKCGKPLTMFEGWTCLECEKAEQEPTNTKLMLMEANINGYTEGLKDSSKAEPCDVFDEYGNYKYPGDVELTEPNTATSMPLPKPYQESEEKE